MIDSNLLRLFNSLKFLSLLVLGLIFPVLVFSQLCPEPKSTDFRKVTLIPSGMDQPVDFGIAADGRIFIAEMQTGNIRLYKPGIAGTSIIGTIPTIFFVNSDDGLTGLELDPNFMQNGWIYVSYSRKVNGINRIFLSRLTVVEDKIDLGNEKVLLSFERPDPMGHGGGGMVFDAQGNLYLSTGDNTGHAAANGFGPFDTRDSIFDDQRSSANTNDLRGKILRVHPEPNGTYTIPSGNLWETFQPPLSTADAAKVKKEIYAMGLRSPFRISKGWDGNLFIADVGPDATADNPTRGRAGFDELNITSKAAFFGFPYCIGDNFGYNRIANISNGTVTYGAPYDCAKPIDNLSPFNTGIKTLPTPVGASLWYTGNSKDFPEMGTGRATAIVGPMYKYAPSLNSKIKFPPQYHGRLFMSDWMRGVHVSIILSGEKVSKIIPFNTSDNSLIGSEVAYEFGPEGALYILQYSEKGYSDKKSALFRIEYTASIEPSCFTTKVNYQTVKPRPKLGVKLAGFASRLDGKRVKSDKFQKNGLEWIFP